MPCTEVWPRSIGGRLDIGGRLAATRGDEQRDRDDDADEAHDDDEAPERQDHDG